MCPQYVNAHIDGQWPPLTVEEVSVLIQQDGKKDKVLSQPGDEWTTGEEVN
jgi:hypothetical protein